MSRFALILFAGEAHSKRNAAAILAYFKAYGVKPDVAREQVQDWVTRGYLSKEDARELGATS